MENVQGKRPAEQAQMQIAKRTGTQTCTLHGPQRRLEAQNGEHPEHHRAAQEAQPWEIHAGQGSHNMQAAGGGGTTTTWPPSIGNGKTSQTNLEYTAAQHRQAGHQHN
eukprot:6171219-Pyramimonas_sp.AAC.1